MQLLSKLLERVIRNGILRLYDPAGRLHVFGGKLPGPVVTVRIHQRGVATKLLLNPELHLGEAYMDGTITAEEGSTVYDFLLLAALNQTALADSRLLKAVGRVRWAMRRWHAVWNGVPLQRCTVHKHRNLLGHAPERLHEEITADYTDMIYATTAEEIEERRKAFVRKWRLRHRAVADSLEEAGDALFAFTRLPPSQWRSARTSNAIERLHEEFKRRIKTQTVLPSADTAAMLFCHCSPPARSTCERSTAGRRSPPRSSTGRLTWPPEPIPSTRRRLRHSNFHTIRDGTLMGCPRRTSRE